MLALAVPWPVACATCALATLAVPLLRSIDADVAPDDGVDTAAKAVPIWILVALGVLAYGTVYHAAGRVRVMLASAWLALVANVSCLMLRRRSRWQAWLWAAGLRWVFVGFGLVASRGIV